MNEELVLKVSLDTSAARNQLRQLRAQQGVAGGSGLHGGSQGSNSGAGAALGVGAAGVGALAGFGALIVSIVRSFKGLRLETINLKKVLSTTRIAINKDIFNSTKVAVGGNVGTLGQSRKTSLEQIANNRQWLKTRKPIIGKNGVSVEPLDEDEANKAIAYHLGQLRGTRVTRKQTTARIRERIGDRAETLTGNRAFFGMTGKEKAGVIFSNVMSGITKFGSVLSRLVHAALGLAGAFVGIAVASTALITNMIKQGAKLENLERGVTGALTPGDISKGIGFGTIRQLANQPGINLEQAAGGFTKLRGVGIDSAYAIRIIDTFSNHLVRAGKSAEDLDGVLTAITQIIGKGNVQAEEINQIAERFPGVRQFITKRYGTGKDLTGIDSQSFITNLVEDLRKGMAPIPRTISDTLSSMSDSFFLLVGKIGQGIAGPLMGVFDQLNGWVSKLVDSGELEKLGNSLGVKLVPTVDSLAWAAATAGAALMEIPSILNTVKEGLGIVGGAASNPWLAGLAGFGGGAMAGAGFGPLGALITGAVGAGLAVWGQQTVVNGVRGRANGKPFAQTQKELYDKLIESYNRSVSEPKQALPEATQAFEEVAQAQIQTAANTQRMVELQEKLVDLNRQVLGGGQLAKYAVSPVNLDQAMGFNSAAVGRKVTEALTIAFGSQRTVVRR